MNGLVGIYRENIKKRRKKRDAYAKQTPNIINMNEIQHNNNKNIYKSHTHRSRHVNELAQYQFIQWGKKPCVAWPLVLVPLSISLYLLSSSVFFISFVSSSPFMFLFFVAFTVFISQTNSHYAKHFRSLRWNTHRHVVIIFFPLQFVFALFRALKWLYSGIVARRQNIGMQYTRS